MAKYNVYHRKDGRWEGRISRGRCEDGKRKYQYIFARSKCEVLRKIDIILGNEQNIKCTKSFCEIFTEWSNSVR